MINFKFTMATAILFSTAAFAQFSSPMRDVENEARFPVYGSCHITFPAGDNNYHNCAITFPSVPTGKPVVIRQVSGRCVADDTTTVFFPESVGLWATLPNNGGNVLLALTYLPNEAQRVFGVRVYQDTRLSGQFITHPGLAPDRTARVVANVGRMNGVAAGACDFFVYGYYVP